MNEMAMGIRWVRRPKARLWPRSWKPTVRITIIIFVSFSYRRRDSHFSHQRKNKLTGPCCRPHTCHQQDPYPVPVCIGVERWIAITVVVPDKGARNAKSDDRGKENKGEKKSMGETNNTFRRHSGFVGDGWGARELLNSRLVKKMYSESLYPVVVL